MPLGHEGLKQSKFIGKKAKQDRGRQIRIAAKSLA